MQCAIGDAQRRTKGREHIDNDNTPGDDMLRQVKRQRSDPVEATVPTPQAPIPASQQTPSASSSALATPTAATAQSRSPAERRDSDEFFTSAIHELDGDDFLLSPEKVTVADINSIAGTPWCKMYNESLL